MDKSVRPANGRLGVRIPAATDVGRKNKFCLFVCRPTREFFTHLEMSPLPVKGYKFLGTYGY